MISVEEAKKQNIKIAGTEAKNSFIISLISGRDASKNMFQTIEIEVLLNKYINITDYSNQLIENLTLTLIAPYDGKGVNWKERKYFKRKSKSFMIDLEFQHYNSFCKATKREAIEILAFETLRGTKKYLQKVKGFDFESFYFDLKSLFLKENIIVEKEVVLY